MRDAPRERVRLCGGTHGTTSSNEPVGMAGNDGERRWRFVVVAAAQKPWRSHRTQGNDDTGRRNRSRSAVGTLTSGMLRLLQTSSCRRGVTKFKERGASSIPPIVGSGGGIGFVGPGSGEGSGTGVGGGGGVGLGSGGGGCGIGMVQPLQRLIDGRSWLAHNSVGTTRSRPPPGRPSASGQ